MILTGQTQYLYWMNWSGWRLKEVWVKRLKRFLQNRNWSFYWIDTVKVLKISENKIFKLQTKIHKISNKMYFFPHLKKNYAKNFAFGWKAFFFFFGHSNFILRFAYVTIQTVLPTLLDWSDMLKDWLFKLRYKQQTWFSSDMRLMNKHHLLSMDLRHFQMTRQSFEFLSCDQLKWKLWKYALKPS